MFQLSEMQIQEKVLIEFEKRNVFGGLAANWLKIAFISARKLLNKNAKCARIDICKGVVRYT